MASKIFESVQQPYTRYNTFDLSHDVKASMNAGILYPSMIEEVIPGDRFHIATESVNRMAPTVAPVMHRIDMKHEYWYVPERLLWKNARNWYGNIKVAGAVPAHPFITVGPSGIAWVQGGLLDHMGIPDPQGVDQVIDAMPLAAYQFIYNECYRDENLITPLYDEGEYILTDGDNTANVLLTVLRVRAWEHDYFTSNLPFAQKGDPVLLPIGSFNDVPVKIDDTLYQDVNLTNTLNIPPNPTTVFVDADAIIGATPLPDNLYAKTSLLQAQAATINSLRLARRLQEWLERAARSGSRYTEVILGHFGVKSPDQRLQRPEFITGSKTPFIISEVLNTSDTATAPQGNMAGHGVAVGKGSKDSYYASEHGWIIGINSIMPKTAYQNGIARKWSKFGSYTDKFWPEFDGIGEQAVKNKEVYVGDGLGNDTFGYLPAWSEYRMSFNRVAGDFRTNLDFWHWGRQLPIPSPLNQAFIECKPDYRIFAVTTPTVDHFYTHVLHIVHATRLIGKYGTPGGL